MQADLLSRGALCQIPYQNLIRTLEWHDFATCFRNAFGMVSRLNFRMSAEAASVLPSRCLNHDAEWLPKPCHGTRRERVSKAFRKRTVGTMPKPCQNSFGF